MGHHTLGAFPNAGGQEQESYGYQGPKDYHPYLHVAKPHRLPPLVGQEEAGGEPPAAGVGLSSTHYDLFKEHEKKIVVVFHFQKMFIFRKQRGMK